MISRVLYAGTLFDKLEGKIDDFKTLLLAVLGALVLWLVIRIVARTGSWVKAVTAIIVGAIVLWGAANITSLRDAFQTEADDITGASQHGSPTDPTDGPGADR